MDDNEGIKVDAIMEHIRERARARRQPQQLPSAPEVPLDGPVSLLLYDLEDLRDAVAAVDSVWNQIGAINPRPPGFGNSLVQFVKKVSSRCLAWYTRPLRDFGESVARSLNETERSCENVQVNLSSLAASAERWKQATIARLDALGSRLSDLEKSQRNSPSGASVEMVYRDRDVKSDRDEFAAEVGALKSRVHEIELSLHSLEGRLSDTQRLIG